MKRIVFLLEELSMKAFLEEFVPRVHPGLDFLCLAHEGKQDLEKSIPRKLRAWRDPHVHFVVMRDNDNADCRALKRRLRALCRNADRDTTLVRIVCQELEAWHLGAMDALAAAFDKPALIRLKHKAKFANPDSLSNAAEEIVKIVPEFRKTDGARRMGRKMPIVPDENKSRSFQVFVEGLLKLTRN